MDFQIIDVFDAIVEWFGDKIETVIRLVINLLPGSPFTFITMPNELRDFFGVVNWFIPINTFISILESWLTAIAIWYAIQTYLRWVKVTE